MGRKESNQTKLLDINCQCRPKLLGEWALYTGLDEGRSGVGVDICFLLKQIEPLVVILIFEDEKLPMSIKLQLGQNSKRV